jgi:hypothetical protein
MMVPEVDPAELDPHARAAIERANAQYERGERIDFDTAASEIRRQIGRA